MTAKGRAAAACRVAGGAVGLAAMAFGGYQLVTDRHVGDWAGVVEWLVAALVLHDGIVVPLTLALGAVHASAAARRVLLITAALTAVALPLLLRPRPTANPSVLPLDYPRGLAIAIAGCLAAATAMSAGRRAYRRSRAARTARAERPKAGRRAG